MVRTLRSDRVSLITISYPPHILYFVNITYFSLNSSISFLRTVFLIKKLVTVGLTFVGKMDTCSITAIAESWQL